MAKSIIQNQDMETMDIKKLAFKISMPMIISMISISLYGIVDTMFVSKISNEALTTISLTFPIVSIITSIGLGIGMGINAFLAKTLGEKNEEKVDKIIFAGIGLTFISWVLIVLISSLGLRSLLKFFTNNPKILKMGYDYLIVICTFSIGSLFQILCEKILEAHGKAKSSMMIQFSGAIINLILDPILIFGFLSIPALGIRGAAISTVTGQFFGMILGIYFLLKSKLIKKDSFKNLKLEMSLLKDILKVGIPTTILEGLSSFIIMILNKILITFSEAAISVWGIYCQLQKFVIIIVYGLNYGMVPILAYNWGAKKKTRVEETIRLFLKLAVMVTAVGALVFFIFPGQIASIYKITPEILKNVVPAFRILSLGFCFIGVSLVFSSSFQAFGNGTYSLIISLSRKIIIVLPLIFILKKIWGIYAIWISFTIAEFVTMIIAILFYKNINKNIIKKIGEE